MKPKVYLESSFISYLTSRKSRDLVTASNQQISWKWWNRRRFGFDLYVSELVLLEIGAGDPKLAQSRLRLAYQAARLKITPECSILADKLLLEGGLPTKAQRDALHIAAAAVHEMDYLLTWNCRHISNAILLPRFQSIMTSWGYVTPTICTPTQLWGNYDDEAEKDRLD